VFVYLFSIFLFRESVTVFKVLSVLLCLSGVFLISFGDGRSGEESSGDALGYTFLIASTVLYALYEVIYRYLGVDPLDNKTEAFHNALFVLGWIGVFTFALFWPGFILLHYTGFEVFELPIGLGYLYVFLLALCESLFNLCLLTGIFLTSPLFISVGSMLCIPFAFITDYFLGKFSISPMVYLGIALIVVGFSGLNYAEWKRPKEIILEDDV